MESLRGEETLDAEGKIHTLSHFRGANAENADKKQKIPRTTKRSQGNDTVPLGTCWWERELKAVLKAARNAEKKEEAIQQASPEVKTPENAGIDELAVKLVEKVICDAISLVEAEQAVKTADAGVDAMPVEEEDADTAADAEVARIITMVVYEGLATELRVGSSLTATPGVSKAPTLTDSADGVGENPIQEIEVEGPSAKKPAEETVQLILYAITKVNGKRPRLTIYDAANDINELSSKRVKRCVWASDNVPSSVVGKKFSPNQALINLRNAVDPSKKSMGSNGINI